jgi:hypothetical protein
VTDESTIIIEAQRGSAEARNGELRVISRDVLSAAIAVRTWPGRKALGFVTFDRREQMKLWAAYGCA